MFDEVVIVRLLPTAFEGKFAAKEAVDNETKSPLITPTNAAFVLLIRDVALAEASYTLLLAVRPMIVSDFAVMSADAVGCTKE